MNQCVGHTRKGVRCTRACNSDYCYQHKPLNTITLNDDCYQHKPLNTITLNDDIKLMILLQLNFDDLMNFCSVDQSYHHICMSIQFWKLYFENNHLTVSCIPKTISEWILAFKKLTMRKMIDAGLEFDTKYMVPKLYYVYEMLLGLAFVRLKNVKLSLSGSRKYVIGEYNIDVLFLDQTIERMKNNGLLVYSQLSAGFKNEILEIKNWLVKTNGL